MRLSTVPDDPGYDPLEASWAKVTVDGKQLRVITTADEELCTAWGYAMERDDDTIIVACPSHQEPCPCAQLWEISYRGVVKIELSFQRERAMSRAH